MPIVKKAPGITTREVKLEEPVNQLLEDYARFIESSPDHVFNSVLKKLWRDQDYRKCRDQRRAAQPGASGKQQSVAQCASASCTQHLNQAASSRTAFCCPLELP